MPLSRRALASTLGVLTLGLIVPYVGCLAESSAFRDDFSRHKPEEVFARVFGQEPPYGLSDLRVSGRHYCLKQWVWMRFNASDEALKDLRVLKENDPAPESEAPRLLRQSRSANNRYDFADEQRVGWEQATQARHPQVYEFSQGRDGDWVWSGILIVDRPNHRVFVHADGG